VVRSSLFQCQKPAIEAQLANPALYGEVQKDALKALILDQGLRRAGAGGVGSPSGWRCRGNWN